MSRNPYRWDGPMGEVCVSRTALVQKAAGHLVEGRGVLMFAGRGMGKSVFLLQLEEALANEPDVKVIRLPEPPVADRTIEGCLRALAEALGLSPAPLRDVRALVREFLSTHDDIATVCLLYDEVDQYSTLSDGEPLGRRLFNHIETARKELGRLGVIAVGGLGLFRLRSIDASPFVSRAVRLHLHPFTEDELRALAGRFWTRHPDTGEAFLDALAVMSGGNPALAVYGLQSLWNHPSPSVDVLREVFAGFREEHREFVWAFRKSVSDAMLTDAPERALEVIKASPGAVSLASLRAVCRNAQGEMRLDPPEVIDLLECAGLARREGALSLDPLRVWPVATIMNLPETARVHESLQGQLRADLTTALEHLHALAADFFRSPRTGGKELVPEGVFAAFIALTLRVLGWSSVEREAQQVAGRTDVKASHSRFAGEVAVVELKIWGRNDYLEIHTQVASYWSSSATAGAAVMITDAALPAWATTYRKDCLSACTTVDDLTPTAPGRPAFHAGSRTLEGAHVGVDHFLVRLPRS